mmetsp:Transcript_4316/g.6642  ORF Transcript_4316/g.6642 Transcript_4316/m.6642 type:complete len:430 (-) Transcript_4316:750-2039(-)|eukprot:CAMPEP_0184650920 /NCGR_PEP_ID=MMETSP0308-20130426/8481_1 /TAXON_ID=38269 /ORGANISM="Gloeochaete witrockiana, Strain SAG 46.84" /LENGTH=429 /DNA_ID=CAMNT_0027084781 /DNA_START=750 /DNA_END=2039 /DNA_ORIENTATION=-
MNPRNNAHDEHLIHFVCPGVSVRASESRSSCISSERCLISRPRPASFNSRKFYGQCLQVNVRFVRNRFFSPISDTGSPSICSSGEPVSPHKSSSPPPGSFEALYVPTLESLVERQFSIENLDTSKLKILAGPSSRELASEIARYVGVPVSKVQHKQFADGETYVQINESVRGCDVFIVQSVCAPVNERLMELLIMVDACKRASCGSVTAVLPYHGYSRADRAATGESITAKLVANLVTTSGASRCIVVDLHTPQTGGFYDIPIDMVQASPVMLEYLKLKQFKEDVVIVSPDVNGVSRARAFAESFTSFCGVDARLAIVDDRTLIGEVEGCAAVILDDLIDTASTISSAARFLREMGAKSLLAVATHPVFSPAAVPRLSSPDFDEVIVTNTISVIPERRFPHLKVLSIAGLLGETILRVHSSRSVKSMFC